MGLSPCMVLVLICIVPGAGVLPNVDSWCNVGVATLSKPVQCEFESHRGHT